MGVVTPAILQALTRGGDGEPRPQIDVALEPVRSRARKHQVANVRQKRERAEQREEKSDRDTHAQFARRARLRLRCTTWIAKVANNGWASKQDRPWCRGTPPMV